MLRLAKDLAVDMDLLRRHHVLSLYAGGLDKLGEEVSNELSLSARFISSDVSLT